MIKRIVKMTFDPGKTGEFQQIFEVNWKKITGFDGCRHVELLRDENDPSVFFTFSLWDSEQHLDNYRSSELFAEVWAKTKKLFNGKPEAWTVREIIFS